MRVVFSLLIGFSLYAKVDILQDLQKAKNLAQKYNKPICLLSGVSQTELNEILEKNPFEKLLQNRCLFAYVSGGSCLKIELLDANGNAFESLDPSHTKIRSIPKQLKHSIQKHYLKGI